MPTFRISMMTHYFVDAKNAKEALDVEADMDGIWNNARYDIEKVKAEDAMRVRIADHAAK